jgi:predicted dehydrogenase
MKIINVGILGYGLSGRIFHGTIIQTVPGFKIKKVMTTDPDKANQAKCDLPNINIVKTADEVINDSDIDLVVIATPNTSHFELAMQALEAGKHVIIEKPFTITSHDALRLIDKESEGDKILSVYHNRRFDGDFLTVTDLINHDKLGRLVEYESHFDRFRNTIKKDAWREQASPGSGILYDLGPHLIDQALYLFGLPHEVYADISSQRRNVVDDHFEIILYYSELKVTLKSGMLVKEPLPRFILHGTDGSFVKYGLDSQESDLKAGKRPSSDLWGYEPKSLWGTLNTKEKQIIETLPGNYRLYYTNIYKAIVHQEKLEVSSQDGFNVIRIIEAAQQSNTEKRRIEIKH